MLTFFGILFSVTEVAKEETVIERQFESRKDEKLGRRIQR